MTYANRFFGKIIYDPSYDNCPSGDGVDAGWNNLFQANRNNIIAITKKLPIIEINLIYIYIYYIKIF